MALVEKLDGVLRVLNNEKHGFERNSWSRPPTNKSPLEKARVGFGKVKTVVEGSTSAA